jgi:chromosome segregation ATPase
MTRGKTTEAGKSADVSDRLDEILAKLAPLEPLVAEVAALKALLKKSQDDVEALPKTNCGKEKEISLLKARLNSLEQHHRGWSIRVNDMPIDSTAASNPRLVMDALYSKVLLPILPTSPPD